MSKTFREVVSVSAGMATSDGAGVNMMRVIGTPTLDHLDPFLLLDVFRSDDPDDYIAGFPAHPHRGFETVTYMFAGQMRHKDNAGNEGVIGPGGVQWMTAGRGIVHSEMPEQEDGLMWGTQLWVNLPSSEKMTAPAYQEYDRGQIPEETRDGDVRVRVVTGTTASGTVGAVSRRSTEPVYLDADIPADAVLEEQLPASHSAFVFVVEGRVRVGATEVDAGSIGILGEGTDVRVEGVSPSSRILLIAARALKEPIARGGPFVMNTQDELRQAFEDFRSGSF